MEVKTALNLVSLRLPARVNDGCKFCKAVQVQMKLLPTHDLVSVGLLARVTVEA